LRRRLAGLNLDLPLWIDPYAGDRQPAAIMALIAFVMSPCLKLEGVRAMA